MCESRASGSQKQYNTKYILVPDKHCGCGQEDEYPSHNLFYPRRGEQTTTTWICILTLPFCPFGVSKIETPKQRMFKKEARRREARKRKIPRSANSETHFAAVDSLLMQDDAPGRAGNVEKVRLIKDGQRWTGVTMKNQATNKDYRSCAGSSSLSTMVDTASLFISGENTISFLVRRHC